MLGLEYIKKHTLNLLSMELEVREKAKLYSQGITVILNSWEQQ